MIPRLDTRFRPRHISPRTPSRDTDLPKLRRSCTLDLRASNRRHVSPTSAAPARDTFRASRLDHRFPDLLCGPALAIPHPSLPEALPVSCASSILPSTPRNFCPTLLGRIRGTMDDAEDTGTTPASPVQPRRHRHQHLARHHSSTGAATEQTPLLTTSTRGRVRIHGDLLTPRPQGPPGFLSRNQSYTGTCSVNAPAPPSFRPRGTFSLIGTSSRLF